MEFIGQTKYVTTIKRKKGNGVGRGVRGGGAFITLLYLAYG